MNRHQLGRTGEDAAAAFLIKQGLEIVQRNFRIRGGEIDIVAREGSTLCLIEVKTRRSQTYGDPRESVSFFKKERLIKAGLAYVSEKNCSDQIIRFDVIVVICPSARQSKIDWIQNAFEI